MHLVDLIDDEITILLQANGIVLRANTQALNLIYSGQNALKTTGKTILGIIGKGYIFLTRRNQHFIANTLKLHLRCHGKGNIQPPMPWSLASHINLRAKRSRIQKRDFALVLEYVCFIARAIVDDRANDFVPR